MEFQIQETDNPLFPKISVECAETVSTFSTKELSALTEEIEGNFKNSDVFDGEYSEGDWVVFRINHSTISGGIFRPED